MPHFKIYPLSTGTFYTAETSLLYYLANDANPGVKIPAVYWMFVLRGPDVVILVDNGPGDPATWGAKYHHNYERLPDQEPIAALKKLGLSPDAVDIVINTHLHWDHCHANHLFSKATIRVQAAEIQEALKPVPAHRSLYTPAEANPPWIQAMSRTVPVNGDEELLPGIQILALPSHTIGFQSVLVDTAIGPILVAGDILPYFDNWTGRWGYDHIPSGIMEASLHQYYACFDRIEKIKPVAILPGVDPKVAETEVYG